MLLQLCPCSMLLSDNAPTDPTSAQTPAPLWVQQPRGWFNSSLWKQAVAGRCPLCRYGGSYGQQTCSHTLTHNHRRGTCEPSTAAATLRESGSRGEITAVTVDWFYKAALITRMHENNTKYHIHPSDSREQRSDKGSEVLNGKYINRNGFFSSASCLLTKICF